MNQPIPPTPNLRYRNDNNEFYKALRSRVHEYFRRTGQTKYANGYMYAKTATLLGTYALVYALMLSNLLKGWALFAAQLIFHFNMFLIVVGIAHDGSHKAYSRKKWVNRLVEYGFDFIGINSHFWTHNHLHSHHDTPNVPLHDSATESFGVVRLHPKTKKTWYSHYQHLYIFPLYAVIPLFLVYVLEPLSFLLGVVGYQQRDRHHWGQIVFMAVSKLIVLSYTLLIPLALIDVPPWQIITGFVIGHFISGLALGIVFQTTHLADECQFPEPDENGFLNHTYPMHIMKTTSSFAVSDPVVTWIAAGLNLHTIHHLFPAICHIHLRHLVPLLRQTAKEYGVPYKEYTLTGAVISHLRLLKRLGNAPSWNPITRTYAAVRSSG
jgi:linoleoyl-CoA desaturase